MRFTGRFTRVDRIGRLQLPAKIMRLIDAEKCGFVEIYVDDNSNIVLEKHKPNCYFCGCDTHLYTVHDIIVCIGCIRNIRRAFDLKMIKVG